MADHAVEVVDLVKRYPKAATNAVDGLSFAVRRATTVGAHHTRAAHRWTRPAGFR
jgi:ABC-2 type transport system ATP-binding protein